MSDSASDPREFIEEVLVARAAHLSDRLAGRTSLGSVVLSVPSRGQWSLRIVEGRLEVTRGLDDDALLQVTVLEEDFGPLVAASLERTPDAEQSMASGALKALSLDARTARGLRHMPGSVAFVVEDGAVRRRVLVSPGLRAADMDAPDCTVTCTMDDYIAMQTGSAQPMQLFADGRLRLTGNVQLALALSGLLA